MSIGDFDKDQRIAAIQEAAESLVRRAYGLGVVLTITQEPLEPLAMGNYKTVVSVRDDLKHPRQ